MKIRQERTVENLLAIVKPYIARVEEETGLEYNRLWEEFTNERKKRREEFTKELAEYRRKVTTKLEEYKKVRVLGFRKYSDTVALHLAHTSFASVETPAHVHYPNRKYPVYFDILKLMLFDLERLDQNQTVVLTIEQAIAMKEIVNESRD